MPVINIKNLLKHAHIVGVTWYQETLITAGSCNIRHSATDYHTGIVPLSMVSYEGRPSENTVVAPTANHQPPSLLCCSQPKTPEDEIARTHNTPPLLPNNCVSRVRLEIHTQIRASLVGERPSGTYWI